MTSLWQTVRLVLQSSPISLPFISFRTSPHVPRLPTPFPPYSSFALPPNSRPCCHKKGKKLSFCPATHLFFRPSLLRISAGPPPFTSLLCVLLPSSRYIKFLNSLPRCHSPSLITTTSPPFRCRLLRIVLRFFGYCPRVGFFAATKPLLEQRCNLCLAGPRIGCFLRFLRCLCFAKPR